ncbi:PREDICTED: microtubule-associated protein 1S [Dipodomys ordii]|uniref:Microtubule-associated protein 1S n=1 Tax=Dipodomys ordii TaxID=10020 RepID=A0A1S3G540_DIPOR|nr:PREDICTED: microtubule-associated protein 1S [Dipodomys ordii]
MAPNTEAKEIARTQGPREPRSGVGSRGARPGERRPGVRSWDVEPGVCSLDEQLKVFVSRHSATFSSLVKGQRSLHHRGETLETLVLLNPSDRSLCDELRNLLLDPAPHKLLVLAGPCLEDTGDLLLQTGGFSPHHFLQVLGDKEVLDALAASPTTSLTITCPTFGDWAQLSPELPGLRLRLNPPARLPASEGLREFLEYLAESLEPPSPFDLLEPPSFGGFLRLTAPCCYVFPGGLGDAAFFAVNGFTVLVNGGSNPKSSFWKLVRHLDRVDAVLVTHAGADSLPGLNSLLRRKVAERGEAAVHAGLCRLRVSPCGLSVLALRPLLLRPRVLAPEPGLQPGVTGWLGQRRFTRGLWARGDTARLRLSVTLIPTFDSATMHRWYEETHVRHQALGVTVLGSNSMVSMQDEAFPACKVEF